MSNRNVHYCLVTSICCPQENHLLGRQSEDSFCERGCQCLISRLLSEKQVTPKKRKTSISIYYSGQATACLSCFEGCTFSGHLVSRSNSLNTFLDFRYNLQQLLQQEERWDTNRLAPMHQKNHLWSLYGDSLAIHRQNCVCNQALPCSVSPNLLDPHMLHPDSDFQCFL